jgi:diketogulonate reductase-like aldo/keto reductase
MDISKMKVNVMPTLIYGTAWKKEATSQLVRLAVSQGFRAIDTANQPKHYLEKGVGEALVELQRKGITRDQLFLQTKFTPKDSQDERIPYDPSKSLEEQVQTSFKSSLEHLHTNYIDSYLLHAPYGWPDLSESDWRVWQTMEQLYESRQVHSIGISNVTIHQLEQLVSQAKIKPMVVQNRCFANHGWDKVIREFCLNHQISYQGFSLLTANAAVWQSEVVKKIAYQLNKTPAQIIFRFAIQLGIIPLTGTTHQEHMQQDLAISTFQLMPQDMETIESCRSNDLI